MVDISCSFVGLHLPSPIIVGSSGLSRSLDKAKAFQEAGAGAIILKSIFEEQIESQVALLSQSNDYTEATDYLAHYVRSEKVGSYLRQIKLFKSELSIPIIASICCMRSESWFDFAEQIQTAGADALEVNIMRIETDLFFNYNNYEQSYVQLISELRKRIKLPIIVKLSRYHTALPALVDKLRAAGADAVTLFNRSYQADINLDKEELTMGDVFSHSGDFADTLRFTAIVCGAIKGIELSASSGVYGWQELTKAILAGATTAQMATVLYKQGATAIRDTLDGLKMWLQGHGYHNLEEVRGRLNAQQTGQSNQYERVQFMRYFGQE